MASSCKISHFGMKPVSGGRPPSDRSIRGIRDVRIGALVHDVARELIVVDLFSINTRKAEEVIMR